MLANSAGIFYHAGMDLKGKTALITGSTGKIGRVLVPALAREGVHCACHYHRQEAAAAELAAEAERLGSRGLAAGADLRCEEQVRRMFSRVEQWGRIDLLILAAGLFGKTPAERPDGQRNRDLIEINLTSPLFLASLFAESIAKREDASGAARPVGKIVCFTDASVERPWKNYSVYCASKAGLAAAVYALARELAPAVTVNAVAPGIVEGSIPDGEEAIVRAARVPMGRFPSMEEIAAAVFFLLKNDSITGRNLVVDGGRIL